MALYEFENRVRVLNDHQSSEHFDIHFNYHNPRRQIGTIAGGVRSRALISFYVDALERLYRAMSGPLFRRQAPNANGRKTSVFVLDLSGVTASGEPFTASNGSDAYIALPCRTTNQQFTLSISTRLLARCTRRRTYSTMPCGLSVPQKTGSGSMKRPRSSWNRGSCRAIRIICV